MMDEIGGTLQASQCYALKRSLSFSKNLIWFQGQIETRRLSFLIKFLKLFPDYIFVFMLSSNLGSITLHLKESSSQ